MSVLGDFGGLRKVSLVAAAGALAAILAAFVPSPLAIRTMFDEPERPEIKAPPPLKLAAVPPLSQFDEITQRPLFNTDRKPDPIPPPPKQAGTAMTLGDLAQYRLLGTIRAADIELALVQKTGGQAMTLKKGDTFEGWTVEDVGDKGVAITGGDRSEVLAIPKANNRAESP